MVDDVTLPRLRVTRHAVTRFGQRVRDFGDAEANRRELLCCMAGAKAKHMHKIERKKTTYVPLGCCILVCSTGAVVTVLGRTKKPDAEGVAG